MYAAPLYRVAHTRELYIAEKRGEFIDPKGRKSKFEIIEY